jgi:hypothetical protein
MLNLYCGLVGALLAGTVMSAWSAPKATNYRGICEASSAVALSAQRFIVADDEHNILWIYQIGVPKPKGRVDLTTYLDTKKKNGEIKKSDLEGAARVGNRIYWIASHSRDGKGNTEKSRLRFFATDLVGKGDKTQVVIPKMPPYRDLLKDLVADSRFRIIADAAAREIGPEELDGLNIEGLAASPQGSLLIGFRNPQAEGMALLVPLLNADAVIAGTAHSQFGDPIMLDLGKQGIRSIDWIQDRYIIIAGPSDKGASGGDRADFALFAWSGQVSEKPKRWVDAPLATLGPEAIFQIPDSKSIHILSDDGDACASNEKDMSFRGIVLDLSTARFE